MAGRPSSRFVQGTLLGGGVVFFIAGMIILSGLPGGVLQSSPGSPGNGTGTAAPTETTAYETPTHSPTTAPDERPSTTPSTTTQRTTERTPEPTQTTQTTQAQNREILYRVNVGGPRLPPLDDGPAWQRDTESQPSRFTNAQISGSHTNNTNDRISVTPAVPKSTPKNLFQTRRWDADTDSSSDDPEMRWRFPVESGTYEVRLYFAETYLDDDGWNSNEEKGPREFDVAIEGERVLDDYDMYEELGHDRGTMKAYTVTVTDGALDVTFLHEEEDPMFSGIEIVRVPADESGETSDDRETNGKRGGNGEKKGQKKDGDDDDDRDDSRDSDVFAGLDVGSSLSVTDSRISRTPGR